MNSFSEKSKEKLATCDERLQFLFGEVLKNYDCAVLCGYRNEAEQNEAFAKGTSKAKYPEGRHNKNPSKAIDVAPCPVDWSDFKKFYHFAGYVCGLAEKLGISIKWGGDWDGDHDFKDSAFLDLDHFELVG